MQGSFLGPRFSQEAIEHHLECVGAVFTRLEDDALFDRLAEILELGGVVGWFQGRMEFGPRALGARSIIGDPRSPAMQSVMNLKIKYRESFRPFAPSVLRVYPVSTILAGQRQLSWPVDCRCSLGTKSPVRVVGVVGCSWRPWRAEHGKEPVGRLGVLGPPGARRRATG
jgi:hypothetical protein